MRTVPARIRAACCAALLFLAVPWAQAQRVATGTGFFITEDGYLLTCFHVIVGSGSVQLRNLKGETFAARVVASDRVNDLAILKADGSFKALPVGPSAAVRRGAAIVTMGFPNISQQGIEPKVTDGIINSFSGANNDPRVFQVSAPIQTGNSGGPLITMDGNVVGVVASKLDAQAIARQTGDIPQNVNYAIKSQHVLDLVEQLAARGTRLNLMPVRQGDSARVADVVPALEDAVVLVIARPAGVAAEPAPPAGPGAQGPPPADGGAAPAEPERQRRTAQLAAEYRQLQRSLDQLGISELTLINQANMLSLMLQFEAGAQRTRREEELARLKGQLDDIGTRKAQVIRRMNELAAEYRVLQRGA